MNQDPVSIENPFLSGMSPLECCRHDEYDFKDESCEEEMREIEALLKSWGAEESESGSSCMEDVESAAPSISEEGDMPAGPSDYSAGTRLADGGPTPRRE
jgi:hypothetical protein